VNRTSGTVTAIGSGTVDVAALGGVLLGLQYPAWYQPTLFDAVIVDWLNQQPYVSEVFAGTLVSAVSSYATGLSYSSPHTARGTAAPPVNTGGAIPFLAARPAFWSAMAIEVTGAAGAGGLCRLGIYADNGAGYPGILVASPGAVPTTAAGVQSVSFSSPLMLTTGMYWLAFQIETAAATLRSVTNSIAGFAGLASAPGAAVFDGLYGTSGWTPGALPTVFPVSQGQVSNLPLLFLTAK
jgi:hypothetical protein